MGYQIVVTRQAKRDIDNLPKVVKQRLAKKLFAAANLDSLKTVARKLTDTSCGDYRLRVGDYRIIFDLDGPVMVVLRVQHRKDVYR